MAELYTIAGAHITTVRSGGDDGTPEVELVERADHGDVGSGRLTIDDTAGTQSVVGHKEVIVTQSNSSFTRTFTGYVGRRSYKMGPDRANPKRFIETTLLDLNARLGFNVIYGPASPANGNRSAETISARLTWLLGSAFLSGLVVDAGFVDYPTTALDPNDYRGQFPADVIRDMALVAGFNFYVYWDATLGASLWFRDSNASTTFSSTLRFSGTSTDVDESTTFWIGEEATLDRDPTETISGVYIAFQNGNQYRTRGATASNFQARDGVAPHSEVKKRATAITLGDAFLFRRRNEEDLITDEWFLPDTKINLVRAGQRVQAKYPRFDTEGYGEFQWFRILETRKRPLVAEGSLYSCGVTLSPQEGGCSVQPTFVQKKYQRGVAQLSLAQWTWRFTLDAASAAGNLLVLAIASPASTVGQVLAGPSGWSTALQNFNIVSGGTSFWCHIYYKKSEGETTADVQFEATGGANPRGLMLEYAGLTNPVLYAAAGTNRQSGLGYASVPATSYPAGPGLVVSLGFQETGPQSGDVQTVDGTNHTGRNLPDSNLPDESNPAIGSGEWRQGTAQAAGTTPLYPAAGGWRFLFTGTDPTLAVGMVFVGDNC